MRIQALDIGLTNQRSIKDGLLPLFSIYESDPLLSERKSQQLADGCVFPDGQVAIAQYGKHPSWITWRSLEDLIAVNNKVGGRKFVRNNGARDGVLSDCFRLNRITDVTGVSGVGVVAIGAVLAGKPVMQWQSNMPSVAWYESFSAIVDIHGHNEATVLEEYSYLHSPGWAKSAPKYGGAIAQ